MASIDPNVSCGDGLSPFHVGDWYVDTVRRQLRKGSEVLKIDPRNLRVLGLLASRAGQVVSQREIERLAWGDSIVTPDSIYQSIAQLRRLFGHDETQRYIETVSRKGYRLVAPVCFAAEVNRPLGNAEAVSGCDSAASLGQGVRPRKQVDRVRATELGITVVIAVIAGAVVLQSQLGSDPREHEPVTEVTEPADPASPLPSIGMSQELPPAYQGGSHYRRSIERLEKELETQRVSVGERDMALIPTLIALGNYYPLVSDPTSCEEVTRLGLAILIEHDQEKTSEGVELNATLSEALADLGRFGEAERYLQRALALSLEVHGVAHYATVSALDQVALLRIAQGRFDDAVREARRAVAAYEHVPDRTTTRKAYLVSTLTWALIEQGAYANAVTASRRALSAIDPDDPPAPYLVAYIHHFLGEALLKTEEPQAAEVLLRREIAIFRTIPHCEMDTARAQSALAEALMKQGRLPEARELLAAARETLKSGDGWRERKARDEAQARIERLKQLEGLRVSSARDQTQSGL